MLSPTRSCEVDAFSSWTDYLRQRAIAKGKTPIFINLDETSVSMSAPGAVGMIVKKRWWGNRTRPRQNISRSLLRSMVTHVGLCCPRTDIQAALPQIFIGNRKCFTNRLMSDMKGVLPRQVQFWQEQSSWNTSALMVKILSELAVAMAAWPELQIILVLDVAPIHFTDAVLKAADVLNIWLCYVPAKCTWLLQPLDTHVFSPYKAYLKRAYRDAKDCCGKVAPAAWANTLVLVATKFMCGRSWLKAFEKTGIIGNRLRLTRDVTAVVGAENLSVREHVHVPSIATLAKIFPRGRKVPYWYLIRRPQGRSFR
jgi:hypothetical protein